MKKYKLAVMIGRFQPFHFGHLHCLEKSKQIAENVLVLVASANVHLSAKNPFDFLARAEMIRHYDVEVEALQDFPYSDLNWLRSVQEILSKYNLKDSEICVTGHHIKGDNDWLKTFNYDFIDTGSINPCIHATEIRKVLFEHGDPEKLALPENTITVINNYLETDEYKRLKEEHLIIEEYKKQWSNTPYPVQFITGDAVVMFKGHFLMVKRKHAPGKDMWALPGGFINKDERVKEGILRELKEETKIDVPPAVLENNLKKIEYFDYPERSLRGRTITFAALFDLNNTKDIKLPKVKGEDDAAVARWFSLLQIEIMSLNNLIFEDHFHIIKKISNIS